MNVYLIHTVWPLFFSFLSRSTFSSLAGPPLHIIHSTMDRGHAEVGDLPVLTEGGILRLIESEGRFTFNGRHDEKQPTLQIINIRRVPANALTDVYWVSLLIVSVDIFLRGRSSVCGCIFCNPPCSSFRAMYTNHSQAVLSDGENCIEVVISTHLSHLVQSGQLEEHTIIKVKAYQYNITDDNIHIISIGEM